jgi:hypothetical protein
MAVRFMALGEDNSDALSNTPFGYATSDTARRTRNHRDFAFKLSRGYCNHSYEGVRPSHVSTFGENKR